MSIVPVTLTQLNRAVQVGDAKDALSLYTQPIKPLSLIKFIGMVSTALPKKMGATSTLYFIQDALSSACSPALLYDPVADDDDGKDQQSRDEALLDGKALPGDKREELQEGVYYVFHGSPRYLRKERGAPRTHIHIDIVHARVLVDFNELTYHGLDVIHTDLTSQNKVNV